MTPRALLAGALVLAAAGPARAHALATNTARVTLRDGAIEVLADVDAVTWLARLSGRESPLLLLDVEPAELARLAAEARRQLVEDLRLEADGVRVPLELRAFPSDAALARAATEALIAAQIAGHPHPAQLRLELAAPAAIDRPTHLRIAFPPQLGDVLINFVQPTTRLTPAGGAASFTVLAPPAAPPRPTGADPLLCFAGALLVGGLAWRLSKLTARTPAPHLRGS